MNLLDFEVNIEEVKPAHLFDHLDPQGEQDNDEENDLGMEEDDEYVGRDTDFESNLNKEANFDEFKYPKIILPEKTDILNMTLQLVPEQKRTLKYVIKFCHEVMVADKNISMNVDPLRLIIHGGAGVGKSFVIKMLSMWAEKMLRKEGQNLDCPRVLITAPTGKAASIIDGMTIHSAFDMNFDPHHGGLSDKKLAQYRNNLEHLKLIIIDEMSMVDSNKLYKIHRCLMDVFQSEDLFANVGIILVGDLLQLKPIGGSYIFQKPNNEHFQSFHDVMPLWKQFKVVVLKQNHRQGEGNNWTELLNRARIGQVTDEDIKLLESLTVNKISPDPKVLHVYYKNDDVHDYNIKMLNKLDTELIEIEAIQINPKGYKPVIKAGKIGSSVYMETLQVKIGARIKLVSNISTLDKLVNGSLGTVIGYEWGKGKNGSDQVAAIIVVLDDPKAGENQRQKYRRISHKFDDQNGCPIFKDDFKYQITDKKGKKHTPEARIIQFPMRLAWASTAHGVQGVTVPKGSKIAVHWCNRMQPGMAYVMLGRCQRMEDIDIVGKFDESQIKCSPAAYKETLELNKRADELIEIERGFFKDANFLIGFVNIRSLRLHLPHLMQDEDFMQCDAIGLAETWLHPGENFEATPYFTHSINNGRGKGLASLTKNQPDLIDDIDKELYSMIKLQINNKNIIFVYISKEARPEEYLKDIEILIGTSNSPTILIGDVNWNFFKSSKMKKFMEDKNFTQLIQNPTHEDNLIDHVYINQQMQDFNVQTHQCPIYYSDHHALFIKI